MIRLFNVHFPTRNLILIAGEGVIVCASLVGGAWIQFGRESLSVLWDEYGLSKILAITVLAVMCLDCFDLYDPHRLSSRNETYFRLLVVLAALSFFLAGLGYFIPGFLLGNNSFVLGLSILSLALIAWRSICDYLIRLPYLREHVYVLGHGDRAETIVQILRSRRELGLDIVGWDTECDTEIVGGLCRGTSLLEKVANHRVQRLIVALQDRRGLMPVNELLALRWQGVKIEDATEILERVSGRIEVDGLYPSWFIFSHGFRLTSIVLGAQRIFDVAVSLSCLVVALPLLPLIMLAIKLTSAGPVLYRQQRVGRNGKPFPCYKFRSMRHDAESASGVTWARRNDPRITRVGQFLRRSRLDELPQLWNVLKGDMAFVGPRPERPELVEWLSREIPYYNLRHIIRPGITGWAQVCYHYGASMEEAKEKLKYDLFFIKNLSLGLYLLVILRSIKTVLLGRGAR